MPSLPNLDDTYNILVTGIGGAGVTTISALLGMAAHVDGHAATTLDATGLAQKGGAVTSHVRIAPSPGDIRSGSIPPAATDVVIGGDIIVSHDAQVMKLFGHSRTHIVMNSEIVPTAEYLSSRDLSYGKDSMLKDVKATAKTLSRLNAQLLSTQFLGDAIYANMIVLGAAWQMGRVPVSFAAMERAVTLNKVKIEQNMAAFTLGRLWQHDKTQLEGQLPQDRAQKNPRVTPLAELIDHRKTHLTAYQNAALAEKYGVMVERTQAAEPAAAKGAVLTREVAIQYARLLSYKDEYEVARLYNDPAFMEDLRQTFAAGHGIKLNLAAPLFAKKDKDTGHLIKREFGPWILKAFGPLARLKGLRGTAFDMFGKTAERKAERALISDFETRMETLLTGLNAANHDLAVKIVAASDDVRGFGHVKEAAMAAADIKIAGLMRRWKSSSK